MVVDWLVGFIETLLFGFILGIEYVVCFLIGRVAFKSNETLVGYSLNICITIALSYPANKIAL